MTSATTPAPDFGLRRWLAELDLEPVEVTRLAGDVSPRSYFRVALPSGSVIAAAYSEELRPAYERFLRTTELLDGVGVRVPRVLESDSGCAWMLLEDLGPETLADWHRGSWKSLMPYLEEALRVADAIAGLPAAVVGALNPPLDGDVLHRELLQTRRLFFESPVFNPSTADLDDLARLFDELCRSLDAAGRRPCHRDFMARNLVVLDREPVRLAVLDHQDLRLGPEAYDVASLLNDSLYPPIETVRSLRTDLDPTEYHRAACQRCLKIVGTFLAFAERGSDRHMPLVRPSYERALEHLRRLPDGSGSAAWMASVWSSAAIPAL